MVRVQTVLLAGDRGHSRAIGGRSKPFLEVAGKPMVVHVLEALLSTPEVSEIYVVGDVLQLGETLAEHGSLRLAAARSCPVHIVPQRSSLYENAWHGFLCTLPMTATPVAQGQAINLVIAACSLWRVIETPVLTVPVNGFFQTTQFI